MQCNVATHGQIRYLDGPILMTNLKVNIFWQLNAFDQIFFFGTYYIFEWPYQLNAVSYSWSQKKKKSTYKIVMENTTSFTNNLISYMKKCLMLIWTISVSLNIRGMILKFWSRHDISVTSNATCLKIVPNTKTFFAYTPQWRVLCDSKERQEIYPETAIPSMHWHIKQMVHIRDLTIHTRAVSAIRFHGCSMLISKPICPVNMANFLYDLGFLACMAMQLSAKIKFWTTWSFDQPSLP